MLGIGLMDSGASWVCVLSSIILKKYSKACKVFEEVWTAASDMECSDWEIMYHTGLQFLIAICTADWRCGCG